MEIFLLTCLLRGMTGKDYTNYTQDWISTHMPLARHDFSPLLFLKSIEISTHMPLARHDLRQQSLAVPDNQFLPTSLLRGMTTVWMV